MLQFVGVIGFSGLPVDPARVAEAGRRLIGDGFGPVVTWHDRFCAMASRRLCLRAGDDGTTDPIRTANGGAVVLGSGRIDRRDDIMAQLGLAPQRGWSDAALMAAAFDRWGTGAASHLYGEFGFAVWEPGQKRLTLARDGFGTVPLYYHRGDGFVVFATNPVAILALGMTARDLDPAMIGDGLVGGTADKDGTIYRAIRRVPRASVLCINPDGVRNDVYWRPKRGKTLRLKDDRAYVEATRAVLADVLSGHLRTQAPIGVMLSGGLDSGAIAATLAMLAPQREIFGFTTVPAPGCRALARGDVREWDYVQNLAKLHPNLRIEAVAEKPITPLSDDYWRTVFETIGMPIVGNGMMARRLPLFEVARNRGIRTLLRGDGGNWTLTAEGEPYLRQLVQTGRWITLLREAREYARFRGSPLGRVWWNEILRDIVPRPALQLWRTLRAKPIPSKWADTFLRPVFARTSGLADQWDRAPNNPARIAQLHIADVVPTYLDAAQPSHSDSITALVNSMGMAWSAPLRDRRLVDFMLSLPDEQFRRNGVTRFIARQALADRMPEETLAKPNFFPIFPDLEEWGATWWQQAGQRLAAQHPVAMATQAIDLESLSSHLAAAPPEGIVQGTDKFTEIHSRIPQTLHINAFLRWHAGANQ